MAEDFNSIRGWFYPDKLRTAAEFTCELLVGQVDSCKNASNYTASSGGEWWQTRVLPFSKMTLKGWTWCECGPYA